MLVFFEHRLAILATPKTGSTAIQAALEPMATLAIRTPPALKHTSAARWHRHLGPYFESAAGEPFTVVALMREPRDWLGSWFRYRQRDDIQDSPRSTADMDFDRFVTDWCAAPQPDHAQVGSQAQFLQGDGGRGVDRIFRYEEIETFVDFLEDRLGHEIILPRLNVSPIGKVDLSPDTMALLRRVAAADFALYDSLG